MTIDFDVGVWYIIIKERDKSPRKKEVKEMEKREFGNVGFGEVFTFNGSVFVALEGYDDTKKAYPCICILHNYYSQYERGTTYYFEDTLEVEVISNEKVKKLLDN